MQRQMTKRLRVCYAFLVLHCTRKRSILSSSFQGPISYASQRQLWLNNDASSDENRNSSNNKFNEKSILGETLDIDLHNGTYSWSNPKAITSDDVRKPDRSSSTSAYQTTNKNHYKRIPFDGCGSILLHQQPESFLAPNAADEHSSETPNRKRQKGRTGVTLWSASFVISYYIDAQWSKGGSWCCKERGTDFESKWTVLELGAGLGLCSAVAAKHGMNVVSTDNDPDVLSLLKDNLERNKMHNHGNKSQQVHVHSLDWVNVANDPDAEHSHPVFLELESLGGADLILLSDVIYGATQPAWDSLLILLNKFCAQKQRLAIKKVKDGGDDYITETKANQSDQKGNPIILLGYTQRRRDMSPQDEAHFFAMIQAAGMEAVLIPSTSIPNAEKYMLTTLFELRMTN